MLKIKIKRVVLLIISIVFLTSVRAQTGAFTETIQFQSQSRNVHYYVDPNYNPTNDYLLFVGMAGCGESAEFLRNNLTFLAPQKSAIIICPEATSTTGGYLGDQDTAFVSEVIQTALNNYSIDPDGVYLHGFSCNGFTTLQMGYHEVYPFKGIIPLHPGIFQTDLNGVTLPFDSNVPTCICSGTLDFGHAEAQTLRDSLQNRNQPILWNPITGVAHDHFFPTFQTEILECLTYFESLDGNSVDLETNYIISTSVYPNPFSDELTIQTNEVITAYKIFDLAGNIIQSGPLNSSFDNKINLNNRISKGTYLIELVYKEKISYHFILKE